MSDQDTIQKLSEALEAEKVKVAGLTNQVKEQLAVIESIVPPEAVYSFSTNELKRDGLGGTWTIRARVGEDGKAFLFRADSMLKKLAEIGWTASKAQTAPLPDVPQPQAQVPSPEVSGGTMHAVLMKVGKTYKGDKPQLVFEVREQQDPLKYSPRNVSDMVQFLKPVGAYAEAQLMNGAKFTVNYELDWVWSEPNKDNKRYQNITAIRAA